MFGFNPCKALAKLRLSWDNGGSYQLRRNRSGEIVTSAILPEPMSAVRQLSARGHGSFDKANQSRAPVQTPADAQGQIEGWLALYTTETAAGPSIGESPFKGCVWHFSCISSTRI